VAKYREVLIFVDWFMALCFMMTGALPAVVFGQHDHLLLILVIFSSGVV
jgi:hypothetical protein